LYIPAPQDDSVITFGRAAFNERRSWEINDEEDVQSAKGTSMTYQILNTKLVSARVDSHYADGASAKFHGQVFTHEAITAARAGKSSVAGGQRIFALWIPLT